MKKILITILESIHPAGVEVLKTYADVETCLGKSREEIIEASKKSDVIIVKSVTKVNKELLNACPNLKIIARAGTGLDNIDVEYARQLKKNVLSTPTGNTISTAEFTLLLILDLYKRSQEIFARKLNNDFRRDLLMGRELDGSTIAIIGLGNVGINVAKRLVAFGVKVIAWDKNNHNQQALETLGGTFTADLDEAIAKADLITLHTTLNGGTKKMVNKDFISKCKDKVLIVNAARGGLIEEQDLLAALASGKIGFYATDVLEEEPPYDKKPEEHNFSHPFINHSKVIYTPHIAAVTQEAQKNIALILASEIKKHLV